MIREEQVIPIGTLQRTHGHRGEIQCHMLNEYWDNAEAEFLILKLDNILVPFRVLDWRGKGADSLIFQLKDVNSEPEAARLVGAEAYMLRTDLNTEQEDLTTWQDLRGFRVIDTEAGEIGTISQVDESTINTLLTLDNGQLMPIHEDFILSIDTQTRILRVNLPFEL